MLRASFQLFYKSVILIFFKEQHQMDPRKKIFSVEVDQRCHESRPCQHKVTIKYTDGTQKKSTLMRSPDIEKQFGAYIPYGNTHGSLWKKHPQDFAENIREYEENKKYQPK